MKNKSEKEVPAGMERLKSKRLRELFAEMLAYLNENRRYRDKTLTSARLAKELKTNVRYIAAVVQANTGENYSTLINRLRLRDVEKKFASRRYDHLSVEEIMVMSGFSSRQCFYSTFKKHHNTTPAEFRIKLKSNS